MKKQSREQINAKIGGTFLNIQSPRAPNYYGLHDPKILAQADTVHWNWGKGQNNLLRETFSSDIPRGKKPTESVKISGCPKFVI